MEVSCEVTTTNELKCIIYDQVISLKNVGTSTWGVLELKCCNWTIIRRAKADASSGSTVAHKGGDRTDHHTGDHHIRLKRIWPCCPLRPLGHPSPQVLIECFIPLNLQETGIPLAYHRHFI